jgi:hypothetical protein
MNIEVIDEDDELNQIFAEHKEVKKLDESDYKNTSESSSAQTFKTAKNDELLWEIAIEEFDSGARKKGLYAKIYAQKNGDESSIKAAYINERFAQLKEEETEKNNTNKIKELNDGKNKNAEELIQAKRYTLKKVRGIDCLLFENGQSAIKVNESKYRLYEDDASLEKSIKYYTGSSMYLTTGLLRIIDMEDNTKVLTCPRCGQKNSVPTNKGLQNTCPSCEFEWYERT